MTENLIRQNYDLGILVGKALRNQEILDLLEAHNDCGGGLSFGDCTCYAIGLIEDDKLLTTKS